MPRVTNGWKSGCAAPTRVSPFADRPERMDALEPKSSSAVDMERKCHINQKEESTMRLRMKWAITIAALAVTPAAIPAAADHGTREHTNNLHALSHSEHCPTGRW